MSIHTSDHSTGQVPSPGHATVLGGVFSPEEVDGLAADMYRLWPHEQNEPDLSNSLRQAVNLGHVQEIDVLEQSTRDLGLTHLAQCIVRLTNEVAQVALPNVRFATLYDLDNLAGSRPTRYEHTDPSIRTTTVLSRDIGYHIGGRQLPFSAAQIGGRRQYAMRGSVLAEHNGGSGYRSELVSYEAIQGRKPVARLVIEFAQAQTKRASSYRLYTW